MNEKDIFENLCRSDLFDELEMRGRIMENESLADETRVLAASESMRIMHHLVEKGVEREVALTQMIRVNTILGILAGGAAAIIGIYVGKKVQENG